MNSIKIDKTVADFALNDLKADTKNLIENVDFRNIFELFGGSKSFLDEMKQTIYDAPIDEVELDRKL
jgi:hypothetical protein